VLGCPNQASLSSFLMSRACPFRRASLARSCEPYFSTWISPTTVVWATPRQFDPFPGFRPLWGDASYVPTVNKLSLFVRHPKLSPRIATSPTGAEDFSLTLYRVNSVIQTLTFTCDEDTDLESCLPISLQAVASCEATRNGTFYFSTSPICPFAGHPASNNTN
jgi:hypothetical protein